VTSPGFWSGFYRLADPKITLASVASMVLATGLAAAAGDVPPGWLSLAFLGVFCLEVAKNASGEVFDWDSGDDQAVAEEDRSPFSGGKRVLVDGLMTRREASATAAIAYAAGIAIGLTIAALREPRVLWIGVAGVALAWGYHAPPLKLSYRGLGELAVAIAYGPLVLSGTYLVLRRDLPTEVVLAGVPLGLAIAAFLWVNEFPDRKADALASKKTLVVRLGPARAARGFALLLVTAYATLVALPLLGCASGMLMGLAGLPVAMAAAARVLESQETRRIVPAQAWALLSFLLMSGGSAVGVYTAPR
jgi:1,4-dihydroxy-2-naphthoate octaprenyltransferase